MSKSQKLVAAKIVGKDLDTAEFVAKKAGYSLRVMEQDGGNCIGTCDFRTDRMNVAVEGDKVTKVLSVG